MGKSRSTRDRACQIILDIPEPCNVLGRQRIAIIQTTVISVSDGRGMSTATLHKLATVISWLRLIYRLQKDT